MEKEVKETTVADLILAKLDKLMKEVEALSERIYDLEQVVAKGKEETHVHHHYSPPSFPQPSRKSPWIKEPEWE